MKISNLNIKFLLLMILSLLVVSGCNVGVDDAVNAEVEKSVLTIGNTTDIESFDVHNNNATVSESVMVNIFEYLLRADGNGGYIPLLATDWEQINDTTWRFSLRDNVAFHNGDPFSSEDVKYTLERVAKDSSLKAHTYYKNIEEVQIVDEHTVDIISSNPDPLMLNRLSKMGAGMLPAKYIDEVGIEKFLSNPIGTGPFQFEERIIDDKVVLVKYENYYGNKPVWEKVVFRAIPETSTRVSELLTGGIDIAAGVPASDVERIEKTADKTVVKNTIQRVLQIIIRHTDGTPTADNRVREAIDFAIDKKTLIESIAGGAGVLTRTSITPGNFGGDPSLYEQSLYDLEKAKQLLQEAGYTEQGPEISLSSSSQYKEYSEIVAAMLTKAGFEIKLDILEPSAFSEKFASKSMGELFMIGIGNSMNDASNNYARYLFDDALGETDYNNPEVESLLQEALVSMDPEIREKNYQQVQQIFAEERPAIYLFQMEGIYGIDEAIKFEPRKDEVYYVNEILFSSK